MHATTRTARVLGASLVLAAFVVAVAVARPARASGSDLAAFLERAERMGAFPHPVRADIRILHGDVTDNAVVVIDPTVKRGFFALKSSGWRALMPLDWTGGQAAETNGGKVTPFGADEPLPRTDLRAIDFFPFWETDYGTAFISDTNRLEKTVTLYARPGVPYVLFVVTFDKEKLVPLTIKFYKDTVNNLVRLRRDSDIVMVGARPRPRHIEIQDFTENSKTTLELTWHTLDSVPAGLTDDAGFQTVDIDWPSEPAVAR
jgi:hypothetical protein